LRDTFATHACGLFSLSSLRTLYQGLGGVIMAWFLVLFILSNIVNIIEGQIKFWLELRKLGK
jgi:hypothetical protein